MSTSATILVDDSVDKTLPSSSPSLLSVKELIDFDSIYYTNFPYATIIKPLHHVVIYIHDAIQRWANIFTTLQADDPSIILPPVFIDYANRFTFNIAEIFDAAARHEQYNDGDVSHNCFQPNQILENYFREFQAFIVNLFPPALTTYISAAIPLSFKLYCQDHNFVRPKDLCDEASLHHLLSTRDLSALALRQEIPLACLRILVARPARLQKPGWSPYEYDCDRLTFYEQVDVINVLMIFEEMQEHFSKVQYGVTSSTDQYQPPTVHHLDAPLEPVHGWSQSADPPNELKNLFTIPSKDPNYPQQQATLLPTLPRSGGAGPIMLVKPQTKQQYDDLLAQRAIHGLDLPIPHSWIDNGKLKPHCPADGVGMTPLLHQIEVLFLKDLLEGLRPYFYQVIDHIKEYSLRGDKRSRVTRFHPKRSPNHFDYTPQPTHLQRELADDIAHFMLCYDFEGWVTMLFTTVFNNPQFSRTFHATCAAFDDKYHFYYYVHLLTQYRDGLQSNDIITTILDQKQQDTKSSFQILLDKAAALPPDILHKIGTPRIVQLVQSSSNNNTNKNNIMLDNGNKKDTCDDDDDDDNNNNKNNNNHNIEVQNISSNTMNKNVLLSAHPIHHQVLTVESESCDVSYANHSTAINAHFDCPLIHGERRDVSGIILFDSTGRNVFKVEQCMPGGVDHRPDYRHLLKILQARRQPIDPITTNELYAIATKVIQNVKNSNLAVHFEDYLKLFDIEIIPEEIDIFRKTFNYPSTITNEREQTHQYYQALTEETVDLSQLFNSFLSLHNHKTILDQINQHLDSFYNENTTPSNGRYYLSPTQCMLPMGIIWHVPMFPGGRVKIEEYFLLQHSLGQHYDLNTFDLTKPPASYQEFRLHSALQQFEDKTGIAADLIRQFTNVKDYVSFSRHFGENHYTYFIAVLPRDFQWVTETGISYDSQCIFNIPYNVLSTNVQYTNPIWNEVLLTMWWSLDIGERSRGGNGFITSWVLSRDTVFTAALLLACNWKVTQCQLLCPKRYFAHHPYIVHDIIQPNITTNIGGDVDVDVDDNIVMHNIQQYFNYLWSCGILLCIDGLSFTPPPKLEYRRPPLFLIQNQQNYEKKKKIEQQQQQQSIDYDDNNNNNNTIITHDLTINQYDYIHGGTVLQKDEDLKDYLPSNMGSFCFFPTLMTPDVLQTQFIARAPSFDYLAPEILATRIFITHSRVSSSGKNDNFIFGKLQPSLLFIDDNINTDKDNNIGIADKQKDVSNVQYKHDNIYHNDIRHQQQEQEHNNNNNNNNNTRRIQKNILRTVAKYDHYRHLLDHIIYSHPVPYIQVLSECRMSLFQHQDRLPFVVLAPSKIPGSLFFRDHNASPTVHDDTTSSPKQRQQKLSYVEKLHHRLKEKGIQFESSSCKDNNNHHHIVSNNNNNSNNDIDNTKKTKRSWRTNYQPDVSTTRPNKFTSAYARSYQCIMENSALNADDGDEQQSTIIPTSNNNNDSSIPQKDYDPDKNIFEVSSSPSPPLSQQNRQQKKQQQTKPTTTDDNDSKPITTALSTPYVPIYLFSNLVPVPRTIVQQPYYMLRYRRPIDQVDTFEHSISNNNNVSMVLDDNNLDTPTQQEQHE